MMASLNGKSRERNRIFGGKGAHDQSTGPQRTQNQERKE
jgi:hypothetical protein